MSIFARIEEACAAFVERTFAKTFHSALEPAQIASKLVATMEAQAVRVRGGTQAPHHYVVRVSADDYHRLAPHRDSLEQEWSALLTDMAQRVQIQLAAAPVVRLEQDLGVVAGSVQIDSAVTTEPEAVKSAPERAASFLRLRVAKGVPLNASVELVGPVTIGRDTGSDLVLSDPGISRRHARVQASGGEYVLRDLQSTNGTFLNGTRVEQAHISIGDVVTLGNTRLLVEQSVP